MVEGHDEFNFSFIYFGYQMEQGTSNKAAQSSTFLAIGPVWSMVISIGIMPV
jgi:hypothetical protein